MANVLLAALARRLPSHDQAFDRDYEQPALTQLNTWRNP